MIEFNVANIVVGHVFLDDFQIDGSKTIDNYFEKSFLSNVELYDLSNKKTMGCLINAAKAPNLFDLRLEDRLDSVKEKEIIMYINYSKKICFLNRLQQIQM